MKHALVVGLLVLNGLFIGASRNRALAAQATRAAQAGQPSAKKAAAQPAPNDPLRAALDLHVRAEYSNALPQWIALAEKGDAFAKRVLCDMYSNRIGTGESEQSLLKWLRSLADQGVRSAMEALAGREGSTRESEKWDQASKTAVLALPAQRDFQRAAALVSERAEAGSAIAQRLLALLIYEGLGVARDEGSAVNWLRKAAQQGDPHAQAELATRYEFGSGVPKDSKLAISWFRRAADQGLPSAMSSLGYIYESGDGVARDYSEAVRWYKVALNSGETFSALQLAGLYEEGKGVPRDFAQASRLYKIALNSGRRRLQQGAARGLGRMYAEGKGVLADLDEASKWYRKAADLGDPMALAELAQAYYRMGSKHERGDGVQKNDREALRWYRKASSIEKTLLAEEKIQELERLDASQESTVTSDVRALRLAAERGHTQIVRQLLENGADVWARDDDGYLVLMFASQRCQAETVKVLLAKMGDVKVPDLGSALLAAAGNGCTGAVKELLAKGAPPNSSNVEGFTALIFAAGEGYTSTVEALLAAGADVNAKTVALKDGGRAFGWTALTMAASGGAGASFVNEGDRTDTVRLLIARGADVNARTHSGVTALKAAEERRQLEIAEMLRKAGAKQ